MTEAVAAYESGGGALRPLSGKLCLDVGCGDHCQPGFVGMDIRPCEGVEMVHDALSIPWPVADGAVEVVLMSHFIEHVRPDRVMALMDEVWRVLRVGGYLMVSTPYGGSFRWHQDPTHCLSWNEATLQYFLPGWPLYGVYRPRPWALHVNHGVDQHFWDVHGDIRFTIVKIPDARDGGEVAA